MLLVQGWMRFAPEKIEELHAIAAPYLEITRAEDGCIHYVLGEVLGDPGLVLICQCWRDRAAYDAHTATPHVDALFVAIEPLEPQSAAVWTYLGEEDVRLV